MIIHDDFIYLRLQKSGSVFVSSFLKKHYNCKDKRINIGQQESGHFGLKEKSKKFVFGGVRNPWDWYVSWYSMIRNDQKHKYEYFPNDNEDFDRFLKYVLLEKEGKGEFFNYDRMHVLDIGLYSHEYFRILCKTTQQPYEIEITKEMVDGVYKQENLIGDLIKLFKLANIQMPGDVIKWLKNAKPINKFKHDFYRKYYTDELAELVENKEKYIINKYEYKF